MVLERFEELGSVATEHIDVLLSQLEGHCLKVEVTRAVREEEAKVNMDHVPL